MPFSLPTKPLTESIHETLCSLTESSIVRINDRNIPLIVTGKTSFSSIAYKTDTPETEAHIVVLQGNGISYHLHTWDEETTPLLFRESQWETTEEDDGMHIEYQKTGEAATEIEGPAGLVS